MSDKEFTPRIKNTSISITGIKTTQKMGKDMDIHFPKKIYK